MNTITKDKLNEPLGIYQLKILVDLALKEGRNPDGYWIKNGTAFLHTRPTGRIEPCIFRLGEGDSLWGISVPFEYGLDEKTMKKLGK